MVQSINQSQSNYYTQQKKSKSSTQQPIDYSKLPNSQKRTVASKAAVQLINELQAQGAIRKGSYDKLISKATTGQLATLETLINQLDYPSKGENLIYRSG